MSDGLTEEELHAYLEKISERGCEAVNEALLQAEQGRAIPEIAHLDQHQQNQVLAELKKVMSVYTSCDVSEE